MIDQTYESTGERACAENTHNELNFVVVRFLAKTLQRNIEIVARKG